MLYNGLLKNSLGGRLTVVVLRRNKDGLKKPLWQGVP
jgi:hypothetical protein